MKRISLLWLAAVVAAVLAAGPAAAQQACETDCGACDAPCAGGWLDGCGDGGGLVFDVELTFLRYFQEGGVTDVLGAPAEFDYELAPRFELGYVGADGLGLRTRYWELDAAATSTAGNPVGVNAYNLDIELFQVYDLGRDTTLELSAGLRYAELWQDAANLAVPMTVISNFSGFGGTMAAEVKRDFLNGDLYARARLSLLMGDAGIRNVIPDGPVVASFADDCTATQTELAMGYEVSRCFESLGVATLRAGVEWQNWANMAVADTAFGGIGDGDVMEDAGFAGFVVGLGLER
ncbi:MAG: Lpg1974 family pore-forming outer membrane protein [Planctomycetota bacterium]